MKGLSGTVTLPRHAQIAVRTSGNPVYCSRNYTKFHFNPLCSSPWLPTIFVMRVHSVMPAQNVNMSSWLTCVDTWQNRPLTVNKSWLGDADVFGHWRSCCCLFLCVNWVFFSYLKSLPATGQLYCPLLSISHCWYPKSNFWDRCCCYRPRVSHSSCACAHVCM